MGREAEAASLDRDVKFFYEQGGYSYDPKVETEEEGKLRVACDLALAERWARRAGITFAWSDDPDDCGDGDEAPTVREQVLATLATPGQTDALYASLGSIGDATDDYRRVVEAELALELRERVKAFYHA